MNQETGAPPPVKLSLPLSFQQELFQDVRADDQLVVLARGLGLLRLVTNLLHAYDAAGNNLVVLVGADERENGWIGEALAEQAAVSRSPLARGLNQVNTDLMSVATRQRMYAQGGVFSITSRILVVDLLSKLLNPETVTGLVILHSERVVATSIEAFIVRIFRQNNKTGFLKAFSDNPESLTTGYSPLSGAMRNLFLHKSSLRPRYHVTVAEALEGKKRAEVVELDVPMSDAMREIQNAVLECIDVSISELRKSGTGLDLEDWTTESALNRNFDVQIRRQLDPVWHRTSFRTRQIVNDLTTLRSMLHALLTYDAVSFNKYLDTVLAANQPPPSSNRHNQSPWLFLDAANTIFQTAKDRVYSGRGEQVDPQAAALGQVDTLRPTLEEQPKWAQLAEVLQEIDRDAYFNPRARDDSSGTVLIMCSDQNSCRQLREYLQSMHIIPEAKENFEQDGDDDANQQEQEASANFMMRRKLRDYLEWKRQFARISSTLFSENQKALETLTESQSKGYRPGRAPPNKRRRVRGGSSAAAGGGRAINGALQMAEEKEAQVDQLMGELKSPEDGTAPPEIVDVENLEGLEDYFGLYEMEDLVVVHPYDGDMDDLLLEEIRPRYVIMYEPDAPFIRRIEVYRSSHTDRNIRVYFMYYGNSVEEQRYLSAVRREKDAFTKLIKEKSSMAMTITHADANLDPQEAFLRTINTRIAGGGRLAATAQPPIVVVDIREFRSSLPSLLHGRSMVVVPCMLTVADYVLSPEICVERKSVKDLIASFRSGRLFNQADTMLQHYKYPMLLIEFEQNKSFTLDPFADMAGRGDSSSNSSGGIAGSSGNVAANPQDIQSKLVLLTIAFPRLKIIWSSSPYQTAEIFGELKKNNGEPDPLRAVQIGLGEGEEPGEQSFNTAPLDMLRTVPGISSANISTLTLEVENMRDVSNMAVSELEPHIGKVAAQQVFRFFNRHVNPDKDG